MHHWEHDLVDAPAWRRATTPLEQLLALFDVFDTWIAQGRIYYAAGLVGVLLEKGPRYPLSLAALEQLARVRG